MKYLYLYFLIGILTSLWTYFHEYKIREPIRVGDLAAAPIFIILWPIFFPWYIMEMYGIKTHTVVFQRPSKEEEWKKDMEDLLS